MEYIQTFLSWFFSFKAFVMLPLLFIIIAAAARMKPASAVANSLRIGVGFAGIFMVFDVFLNLLKPAVEAMILSRGLDYPVVDAGWPPLAAITWSSWIAPVIIVLVIVLNLIMLLSKTTTVLYVDLWNYWHFALIGAMLLAIGMHPAIALAGALFSALVIIKTTEWTAPYVKQETGIEGIAVSPLTVSGFLPWTFIVNKLLDKIPVVRDINWNPSRGSGKWAKIGDPVFVGFGIGILFGILAKYDFKQSAELAVQIAAVMFILPHCGSLIGKGTAAISTALQNRLEPLFGGRKFLIAMDTGFLMNNPSVIVTGMALMPISILLAFIMPGNRIIPAGDLPNLISIMSITVIVSRSNVFRSLVAAIPIIMLFLFTSSKLAPLITELAVNAGALEADGTVMVSSFTDGGNPLRWWIFELFRGDYLAIGLLIPLVLAFLYTARKRLK